MSLLPEAYRESFFWLYHLLNPMATYAMMYRKLICPPSRLCSKTPGVGAQAAQFPDMPLPYWLLGVNLLMSDWGGDAGAALFSAQRVGLCGATVGADLVSAPDEVERA
jgi:hypothetical protein